MTLLLIMTMMSVDAIGPAGAQNAGQPPDAEGSGTAEAAAAFALCGTRFFSSRGRLEPARGFADIEPGLRNACFRELTAYRQAALPDDASRSEVNKAVRALQSQHRRQFRAAYDAAAAAEIKRRLIQDVVVAPSANERIDDNVSDGSVTDAQTPTATIPPAFLPAPRVASGHPIPFPPPRPPDLAGPAASPAASPGVAPAAPGSQATPTSAGTMKTVSPPASSEPPSQRAVQPEADRQARPVATAVHPPAPADPEIVLPLPPAYPIPVFSAEPPFAAPIAPIVAAASLRPDKPTPPGSAVATPPTPAPVSPEVVLPLPPAYPIPAFPTESRSAVASAPIVPHAPPRLDESPQAEPLIAASTTPAPVSTGSVVSLPPAQPEAASFIDLRDAEPTASAGSSAAPRYDYLPSAETPAAATALASPPASPTQPPVSPAQDAAVGTTGSPVDGHRTPDARAGDISHLAPRVASLPTPLSTNQEAATTRAARRDPSTETVQRFEAATGQHRVCLARSVLSASGDQKNQDVLASALNACSELQEARIALGLEAEGPSSAEAAQRVKKSLVEATRSEALELIGLLRGTKP